MKERKTMMSNKIITYVFTSLCGGVGKHNVCGMRESACPSRQTGQRDFEFWERVYEI